MSVSGDPIRFTSCKSSYAVVGNTTGISSTVTIADASHLFSAAASPTLRAGSSESDSTIIIALASSENTIVEKGI